MRRTILITIAGMFYLLFVILFVAPVLASEVLTPVPRPESWSEVPPAPERDVLADQGRIELGLAAWSPHATDAPSRVSTAGGFESGFPEVRAAYVSPALLEGAFGRVSLRGGLGFARLSRTAGAGPLPGASLSSDQQFYLVPLRASAEWRPLSASLTRVWEPRISASLLPTLGFATRSALDDGGTHFGVPIEIEAVVALAPGKIIPLLASNLGDRSRPVLSLGASFRAGKVDWVNVLGAGVNAGVSFGL